MGCPPAPRKIFPDFDDELGFSGSAFASAPLSKTTEIFTIPFLVRSSATCPQNHVLVIVPQRSENRAALVKAPTSPGALLAISLFAGHDGPSTFAEYITQSWWRAHQTRIAAKVLQMECIIFLLGPAAVFIGVFSFRRILFQVVYPSFTGTQPRGVPNRSAKVACEAFSHAFGLSSTLAFALAFPLGFLYVPSCFLRLLPRLAVARRILSLWCALPLSSRGRFLGPLTRFPVPLLLPFRSRVERFDNCAQRLCELLD